MCEDFKGFFVRTIVAKRQETGVFEKLYVLRDLTIGQRIIGIFDEDYKVTRFWDNTYIPSKRRELQDNIGKGYEIDLDKIPVFIERDEI